MTIVLFPRDLKGVPQGWRDFELQQVTAACAEVFGPGHSAHWDVGMTECGDPQLYVVGSGPDEDCVLCISRVGHRYVLEDGRGRVLFENDDMARLAGQTLAALRRQKAVLVARVAVCWCAVREFFEEKIEPAMAEPLDVLAHIAPQWAAVA
jgi:hypothetical protein